MDDDCARSSSQGHLGDSSGSLVRRPRILRCTRTQNRSKEKAIEPRDDGSAWRPGRNLGSIAEESILVVQLQDFPRPCHLVFDSLTRWVRRGPKLQILQSVVVTNVIHVVNRFFWAKFAAEMPLHDEAMF